MQLFMHVSNIIKNHTQNFSMDIIEDTCLNDIVNWDSLVAIQIMMVLEKEFSIKIPIYQFMACRTVKDIINIINLDLAYVS